MKKISFIELVFLSLFSSSILSDFLLLLDSFINEENVFDL